MGRAIVREPQVFLMDEPLSNLDAKLRVQVRAEIARIQRDLQVTTIYVTHDQSEAVTLGDRICVLRDGVLQQVDRPQTVYERPANLFVASFIGSPAMNLVEAELAEQNGALVARFGPHQLSVPQEIVSARPRLRRYAARRVVLGIRPEDIGDQAAELANPHLDVTVDIREDMGSEVFLHFAVDAPPVKVEALKELVGEEALEAADIQTHHHGSPFVARAARGTTARAGERARLSVTPGSSTSSISTPAKRSTATSPARNDPRPQIETSIVPNCPAIARARAASVGQDQFVASADVEHAIAPREVGNIERRRQRARDQLRVRLSGTQIDPSCCSGVFVDQSAESVASVELALRVRTDEA